MAKGPVKRWRGRVRTSSQRGWCAATKPARANHELDTKPDRDLDRRVWTLVRARVTNDMPRLVRALVNAYLDDFALPTLREGPGKAMTAAERMIPVRVAGQSRMAVGEEQ